MTNGKANFTYISPLLETESLFQCYDVMYGAMVGSLSESSYCENLPSLVQEPCGCTTGGGNDVDAPGSTAIIATEPVPQPSEKPVSSPSAPPPIDTPGNNPTDGSTEISTQTPPVGDEAAGLAGGPSSIPPLSTALLVLVVGLGWMLLR